ncbi:MAG: ABC transporter ATP-binding protein [Clostridiales bacterium]|nr:ABC transporter ATP-binding protein [Clostridiales bacterium]
MKAFFKKQFALTDTGAAEVVQAMWSCFWVYCINMLPAFLLLLFMDGLVLGHVRNPYLYVGVSAATLLAMFLLMRVEYDRMYNTTYRESAHLRIELAEKLADLPLSYFSKHDLSDLSQSIMEDVAAIEHSLSHSVPKAMGMAIFFPLISLMMLIGNWKLGLAVILPLVFSFALLPISRKVVSAGNKRYYDILRRNSEAFQETIELQQEIKSFNLVGQTKADLFKKMEESEKIHIKTEFGSLLAMGLSNLFSYVSLAVVIIVGAHLLMAGEISLLYLLGYLLAAIKVKEALDASKEGYLEILYIGPRVARIKEIRNTPVQEGAEVALSHFDIELKDVTFAYDADTPVVRGVSFTARQGEVTALVGASGCGKTSILRLISRLYDYDGGRITIGGQDIKQIAAATLFSHISIVFQDVTLFNTSVMENIRIGRKDATDEEVRQAAEAAHCLEFINRMPEGFDTLIGENGAELSGGERQRLSIARAILKNAPILILDEIAASLDVTNEKAIQESLNHLIQNKTVIIISHRMKSIENVNKIVVLDAGRVEAVGSHAELADQSPTYRNLLEKNKLAEAFVY